MRQSSRVFFLNRRFDEFALRRRNVEQQFQGFNPRFINFLLVCRFIAVAEMQANIANQFFAVIFFNCVFKYASDIVFKSLNFHQ